MFVTVREGSKQKNTLLSLPSSTFLLLLPSFWLGAVFSNSHLRFKFPWDVIHRFALEGRAHLSVEPFFWPKRTTRESSVNRGVRDRDRNCQNISEALSSPSSFSLKHEHQLSRRFAVHKSKSEPSINQNSAGSNPSKALQTTLSFYILHLPIKHFYNPTLTRTVHYELVSSALGLHDTDSHFLSWICWHNVRGQSQRILGDHRDGKSNAHQQPNTCKMNDN